MIKSSTIKGKVNLIGLSFFLLLTLTPLTHSFANEYDPAWLKIMRYTKTFTGFESEVDTKFYFLSKEGKTSPKAELLKTLEVFRESLNKPGHDKHPICQFPGRFQYIKEKYNLTDFDFNQCPEYKTYQKKINAHSLSLIFSSYYINRPASAFGHTLLKINSKDHIGNDLFSYGVDFSAQVTTSNPLLYGVFGVTGGFTGRFTLLPYFLKLREYNDYESRDLWDFELDLNEKQMAFAIAHLWDMNNAGFDYFYLTENCSYHVLRFIDAVVPEYDLMGTQYSITVPIDTLFPVLKEKGLIKEISFRPSLQKRLNSLYDKTSSKQKDFIKRSLIKKKISSKEFERLNDTEKAYALDVLINFIDYKYAKDIQLKKDENKIQDFKMQTLLLRSKLQESELPSKKLKVKKINIGHKSRHFSINILEENAKPGLNFSNRVALHNIKDPSGDVFKEFTLEMGRLDIDIFEDEITLNQAELARVLALRPVNLFEQNFSWNFDVGIGNSLRRKDVIAPYANVGVGYAKDFLNYYIGYLAFESGFRQIGTKQREYRSGPKLSLFMKTAYFGIQSSGAYFYDLENSNEYNEFTLSARATTNLKYTFELEGIINPFDKRLKLGMGFYY